MILPRILAKCDVPDLFDDPFFPYIAKKEPQICLVSSSNHVFLLRFLDIIIIAGAAIVPITKLLKVKTKLIGTEGTRLLREKRVQGDPAGASAPRRLPDRPRKASAWSGNQRSILITLKKQ
ncbi:hypothetical protein J7J00_03020 [Bacillus sp. ISL-4]|uniref:hypothetical protein n=1 Tax=Bacillus sp. ISL-4 TaxID=2819125 RepID=UPI001BE7E20E|nr:hypothetical protein [Bacillus sp. ISL-4]MBT2664474.1 hypothetical protein [Bacillus sp. ISL-4]